MREHRPFLAGEYRRQHSSLSADRAMTDGKRRVKQGLKVTSPNANCDLAIGQAELPELLT